MTNLRIQHAKSALPVLETFSAFESHFRNTFYDPYEEQKAVQELYNLRQGSTPIAKHILRFETLRVRSSRFSQGDSCVKEFVFSLNTPTQKRLNMDARDKDYLLTDYNRLRQWLLEDAALDIRFATSSTPTGQLPAPVFDDPMDLGQVINSLAPRWTRMPDTVYKKVAEVFDEAGICRICRDYVASGHQPGSLRRLAGKDNTEKSNYFVLSCVVSTALSADDVRSGPRSLSLPLHFAAGGVVTALIETGAHGNLLISQYAVSFRLYFLP